MGKGAAVLRKPVVLLFIVIFLTIGGCGNREGDSRQSGSHLGNTGMPGSKSSAGYSEDITMNEIREAVVDILGDNYWPDTEISGDVLESDYGISPDMYDDYLAESFMDNENTDTLIVIKAKYDRVDDVEKALKEYWELNNSGSHVQDLGKEQAARIETFQNYVCFVQLGGNTDAASEISNEAVVDQCLEENERSLDAIEKAILR